jgi:hypothetical protein
MPSSNSPLRIAKKSRSSTSFEFSRASNTEIHSPLPVHDHLQSRRHDQFHDTYPFTARIRVHENPSPPNSITEFLHHSVVSSIPELSHPCHQSLLHNKILKKKKKKKRLLPVTPRSSTALVNSSRPSLQRIQSPEPTSPPNSGTLIFVQPQSLVAHLPSYPLAHAQKSSTPLKISVREAHRDGIQSCSQEDHLRNAENPASVMLRNPLLKLKMEETTDNSRRSTVMGRRSKSKPVTVPETNYIYKKHTFLSVISTRE